MVVVLHRLIACQSRPAIRYKLRLAHRWSAISLRMVGAHVPRPLASASDDDSYVSSERSHASEMIGRRAATGR